jgi:hypothetical protein
MIATEPNTITGHNEIARARTNDPETSHEAAYSVEGLTLKQSAVLWVFKRHGQMTHESLLNQYSGYELRGILPRQSAIGLRTRAHELAESGKLADTGTRSKTLGGRNAIVWRAL